MLSTRAVSSLSRNVFARPFANASRAYAAAPAAEQKSKSDEEGLSSLKSTLNKAVAASKVFATYSQDQVDKIFRAAAEAANAARLPLAKMAVEETRMGVVEDKVIKNHFASEFVYSQYKNTKTCGLIAHDPISGYSKFAEPMGVIAGIIPTTNPTSTAIFKTLLALKTRNALVICPHPRAAKCTIAAAKVVLDAAVAAGAPADIITWIDSPSSLVSGALMKAPEVSLVLATGGPGMVRAAYSSGHPSLGVGAGNTPALIDETADIELAVNSVLISKTFDNGVICASEQSIVAVDAVYDKVRAEFVRRGAYFLNEEEKVKVRKGIEKDGKLNADIVGQPVAKLAQMFGITVPAGAKVLIGEVSVVGKEEPLSQEKLSPILAMYRSSDFNTALATTHKLIMFGGAGHTSVIYTHPDNRQNIEAFQAMAKTGRILVNSPSSQGAIGGIYNQILAPSMTLGCGSWGGNIVSDNIGPLHLVNVKSVAERRHGAGGFNVPATVLLQSGGAASTFAQLSGKKVLVVADKNADVAAVSAALAKAGAEATVFNGVGAASTLAAVQAGLKATVAFHPDTIVAVGGGAAIDAAKLIWLGYEHPETRLDGLTIRFMDMGKRVYNVPALGAKASLIAIPTAIGSGSEVTPFSSLVDEATGKSYTIADAAFFPSAAIVDPSLIAALPKAAVAAGAFEAISHAVESFVSIAASDRTKDLSREALTQIFDALPSADAEKVLYASTKAGMAYANAFLGVTQSLANKVAVACDIPVGVAAAVLLPYVIRYNATDAPFKQAIFPSYHSPRAVADYAELANALKLGGSTPVEKAENLAAAIEGLRSKAGVPSSLKAAFGSAAQDAKFLAVVDKLAEEAFDDQCSLANPRYPLIEDLKAILVAAHQGL
eukprot:CAMPEP_0175050268 /NCGR_PEP_ID=MMETSP0052_2-20121109/7170_1 /TAXON_ID=51329 ORGANISM="Polytomella parva, Strain SAG 63-3" /NCGR_SAMPLE_ID=MMETSP0052_2 /ASSEMBLY_ACC=CAM_ASM_000194 /LENGTH=886 /DNA_ID=CAMNT_0016314463 /DNA_START=114 /DNA_END=2774 /DNA_ORIENTATION=+